MRRLILICAAVLFFALTGISFGDINGGLQAWYAFSGNANDGSGHGYNGTVYNATLTNDRFGNSNSAYYFNGSNAYIGMGNPAGLNFTGAITMAAWIRPDEIAAAGTWRNIVSHGFSLPPETEVYFRISNSHYQTGSYIQDSWDIGIKSYDIPANDKNNWVHLVGLNDGSRWRLYRNGVEVASMASTVGAIQINWDWAIGAKGGGARYFTGAIDDVRIYNRALSAAEVQELYQVPEPATIILFGLGGLMLRKKI